MARFLPQTYRISDISGWADRKELKLAPGFQRRSVWSPKGKSFLIDSILRGMPLPQFFIREIVLPKEKRMIREVVDGQQRIAAILGYMKGDFTVYPTHNPEFGRIKYAELPEDVQRKFLSFPLSVNLLEDSADRDVLEVFSRLNAYSVPLNQQEKLNAKYVGSFNLAMQKLSKQHLAFWQRHDILSNTNITRMKDVELTSELVAAMLLGLQNQKKVVAELYERYDDAFPQIDYIEGRFAGCLQLCEMFLGGNIGGTIFRRSTLFYVLFCAIYDCWYGFGAGQNAQPRPFTQEQMEQAEQRLIQLSATYEEGDPPPEFQDFYRASRESQDKFPQRQRMHATVRGIICP